MAGIRLFERIGPTGYMFPELACIADANEGGGLICYSDSAFGLFETGIAPNCGIVGIEENNKTSLSFSTFPNPFSETLTLEFADHSNYEIRLFDLTGKEMLLTNVKGSELTLPTSHLPAGTYIIQARSEDNVGIRKLIKN